MITYGIARADHGTTLAQDRTSAVIAAGGVAFLVLLEVARPLNAVGRRTIGLRCHGRNEPAMTR